MINTQTIEPSTLSPDNRHNVLSTFNRMPFNAHQPDQELMTDYLEMGQVLSGIYGNQVGDVVKNTANDYLAFTRAVDAYTSMTIEEMELNRSALLRAVFARDMLSNALLLDMTDEILGFLPMRFNKRSGSEVIRELIEVAKTEEYQFISRLVNIIKSCIDQNSDETETPDLNGANTYGERIYTAMESADPDADDLLRQFIIEHTLYNALRSNVEPLLEPEGSNYSLIPDPRYDGRFDLRENS